MIKARALNASTSICHIDESVLRVIDEDRSKNYIYQITTSRFDDPVFYFNYTGSRSSDSIRNDFDVNKKYIICCDGFPGYEKLNKEFPGKFELKCCNFHARKKFIEANDSLDEEFRESSISGQIIKKYGEIFSIEDEIKNLPPSERKSEEIRLPIKKVEELISLVESIDAEKESLLDEAKNYFMHRKDILFTYLNNGYLDMTNNRAERNFKIYSKAKSNFLHCRTKKSAKRMTDCYSVLLTALNYGIDLYSCFTYIYGDLIS